MGMLTDRADMTLDVYRGRKTTIQQQQQQFMLRTGLSIFSIGMLGLRTTFIMEDKVSKFWFTTYEVDKISCKLVDCSFEPLGVQNMIKL